jgi:acyl carrier protein
MEQKTAIREFVNELLSIRNDTAPVRDDDSLMLSGRLQSLDAVRIVMFLEETFGVNFGKIGFHPELIDSLDSISALAAQAAVESSNRDSRR